MIGEISGADPTSMQFMDEGALKVMAMLGNSLYQDPSTLGRVVERVQTLSSERAAVNETPGALNEADVLGQYAGVVRPEFSELFGSGLLAMRVGDIGAGVFTLDMRLDPELIAELEAITAPSLLSILPGRPAHRATIAEKTYTIVEPDDDHPRPGHITDQDGNRLMIDEDGSVYLY